MKYKEKSRFDQYKIPGSLLHELGGGLLSNDASRELIETYHDYGTIGWKPSQYQYLEYYKEIGKLRAKDSIVFKYVSSSLSDSDLLDYICKEYQKYKLIKSPRQRRDFKECGLAGIVLFCHGPFLSFDDFLWASMDYDDQTEHVYQRD